jgi:hypothetical protein
MTCSSGCGSRQPQCKRRSSRQRRQMRVPVRLLSR